MAAALLSRTGLECWASQWLEDPLSGGGKISLSRLLCLAPGDVVAQCALVCSVCECVVRILPAIDHKQETVKSGENATLQCQGSRDAAVVMLKWRKPDLQSELENTNKHLYVLYIRDGRNYENYQIPSFKGRVQLRDPQMKDGDLSVILRNVSMNDAGIYECYAGYGGQEPQVMSSTNLKVEEPGPPGQQSGDGGNKDEGKKDGEQRSSVGLIVGLLALAVLVVGAVGVFMIYRKCKKSNYQHPKCLS